MGKNWQKTGSTNKDLYLSKPRLTTRGVENIALLEEPSVNQTDSGRLDTKPTTLNQDQEKDDNEIKEIPMLTMMLVAWEASTETTLTPTNATNIFIPVGQMIPKADYATKEKSQHTPVSP